MISREVIPHDQWRFACAEFGVGGETQSVERAVVPSARHIYLPAGFQPGWIYELVYTAKDPLVHGLGHVAVRDFISFLKYDRSEGNPLRGVEKAYAWGRSQTGRCLRDFVYRGFNADAEGRRVFDGVLPHVAGAGRKWLNHRFASPIVSGGQQYEDHFNIADSFPFSYAWSTDHLTGKQDAILKRPDTDPLVMHTQTSTEYWVRRGSLAHTDTQGNDLKQPDTVRVYCWSSSQHFADPQHKPPSRGIGQNFSNVVSTSMFFRAHLDAMDRWATDGTRAPGKPDSAARRWDAGEFRGMAAAVPNASRAWRRWRRPMRCRCWILVRMWNRGFLREPPAIVPGGNSPDAPASNTPCWCLRWIAMATTCQGSGRRWWRRRSALTQDGIRVRAAMAMARSCGSRAATSRFRTRRSGRSPAIRAPRSWNVIPTRRRMSRRSLRRRANWWRRV